jgi:hypothetical protein
MDYSPSINRAERERIWPHEGCDAKRVATPHAWKRPSLPEDTIQTPRVSASARLIVLRATTGAAAGYRFGFPSGSPIFRMYVFL